MGKKHWNMIPEKFPSTAIHQVLYHYNLDINNNKMIDNILLISGGALTTNNSFSPSIENPIYLDMRFKLFTVTDQVLIDFCGSLIPNTHHRFRDHGYRIRTRN